MRAYIFAFILFSPALSLAGAFGSLAANAPRGGGAVSPAAIPVSAPAPAQPAARPTDAAWINAVKKAYRAAPVGTLPPAQLAELPPAALQQLQWDAQVYPSKAYRLEVDGRVAYAIENDNLDALYVNIFDAAGAHIAYGGFDENYDFWWLSKKRP